MAAATCKECKNKVPSGIKVCPFCGAKKPGGKWWQSAFGLLCFFLAASFVVRFISEGGGTTASKSESDSAICGVNDGECIFNHNLVSASIPCRKMVEGSAKYDHEWTDGVFGMMFSHFRNDPVKGQIVYVGDKVRFANGFNAKIPMTYSCTYDLKSKKIVDFDITEGRL